MAGSKAFFQIEDVAEAYLQPGSDDLLGCAAFFDGVTLNVNKAADKRLLRGLVSGLRKIADGIQRDAHLNKLTK